MTDGHRERAAPGRCGAEQVSLSGAEAHDWLAALGWEGDCADGLFRLFGSAVRGPTTRVARVWHGPGRHRLRLRSTSPGSRVLMLPVEGSAQLRSDGRSSTIGPGALAVLDPRRHHELLSHRATARVEMLVAPAVGSAHDGVFAVGAGIADGYRSFVLAVVDAILTSPLSPADPGFPFVESAVHDAVGALLTVVRADTSPALEVERS